MDQLTDKPGGGIDLNSHVPRVLLVDDDMPLIKLISRMLHKEGFECTLTTTGDDALQKVMHARYDVIVSDIHMPGMSGVELLQIVRAHDEDVPVILMTGGPDVASAIQAVELGALSYVCKPFDNEQLLRAVKRGANLHAVARLKRQGLRLLRQEQDRRPVVDGLNLALDRAMQSLNLFLHPIVSLAQRRVVAYEALMRSSEPTLPNPPAILEAAEQLQRVWEIGRAVRRLASERLQRLPPSVILFINLHPRDLLDSELAADNSPLAGHSNRVVLEITERATLEDVPDAQARVSILRFMGYRFALDDMGVGRAGLGGFFKCEPEFVKLDMGLVRNVNKSVDRQRLLRSLRRLCNDLGADVIAEGVERAEERDVLAEVGCDLMQGYLFARPAAELSELDGSLQLR